MGTVKTEMAPKDFLGSKGLSYCTKGSELVMHCVFDPNCDQDSNKDKGHLYMSTDTGAFQCKKCGRQGNFTQFRRHVENGALGVQEPSIIQPCDSDLVKVVEECHKTMPGHISMYLNQRGISDKEIKMRELGCGRFYRRSWITIPVRNDKGNLAFLKLRRDPKDKGNSDKYKVHPLGQKAQLYPWSVLESVKDNLFICEGEFDQMVLASHSIPAVTSTAGSGTFKREWLEKIKPTVKVFLCFDNDKPGKMGAQRLARMFSGKGNEVYVIPLPEELNGQLVKDVTDYFLSGGTTQGLFECAKAPDTSLLVLDTLRPSKSPADLMLQLLIGAKESGVAFYFRSKTNEVWAKLKVNNHYENHCVDSRSFGLFARRTYLEAYGKGPTNDALKTALANLEAALLGDLPVRKLNIRVAQENGVLYCDLCNDTWEVVKITSAGWEITQDCPVFFSRFSHQQPQVYPDKSGDVKELLRFLHLDTQEKKDLTLIWLLTAFIPDIPRPIPVLYGSQGAAKSFFFRLLREIIDPSELLLLSQTKDKTELVQQLSHHYFAPYDNLTTLPDWTSDVFSRAVTGEGASKRKLFTDNEDIIYSYQRCIGLNGINLVALKPDLLDRSILIEFQRILPKDRRDEKELLAKFNQAKPRILAGVFDALSRMLRIYPTVNLKEKPRMADFARYGYAAAEALGIGGERFLSIYQKNRNIQDQEVIDSSPVAICLVKFMEDKDDWKGTASELLGRLGNFAEGLYVATKGREWPKTPQALVRKLNLLKTNLAAIGIIIEPGHWKDKEKIIRITASHSGSGGFHTRVNGKIVEKEKIEF